MTSIEIKKKIEEEKRRIEEELQVENQELKLYQDFFEKYSLIDVKKYDQIDCGKFFVLYLHSTNPEKWLIKELEELVKSNHLLFLKANSDSFRNLINAVRFMIETKDADAMKELMQEKVNPIKPTLFDKLFRRKKLKNEPIKPTLFNKIFRRKELMQEKVNPIKPTIFDKLFRRKKLKNEPIKPTLFNKIFRRKELSREKMKKNLNEIKKGGCDIEKLLNLLEREDNDVKEALSLVKMMKESGEFKESIGEELIHFLKQDNIKASKEEIEKITGKSWEAIVDKKRLFKALEVLKSYYEKLEKQESARKRNLNKQMRDYKQLEKLFSKAKTDRVIRNVEEITEKISNPLLRIEILKYIYLHNLAYQEQVESDYQNVFREESAEYKEFLLRNNLSTDNLDSYMTKSIPELEYMLERLKKLNIQDVETVLKTSTPSRVQELGMLIKSGVMTEAFVKENTTLFDTKKPHYQVLTTNQRILQENRVNPSTMHLHQEVLFARPSYLENNLSTLQEYLLPLNWMGVKNVQFLNHPNLARKIDKVLELGYETLLESNMELLNYDDKAWNRLELLKALDIPLPTTKEEVEGILESPHFLLPEENVETYREITPYIERKENLDIVPMKSLPIDQETTRTYTIGGVIFSKPKVVRNLSQLEKFTPIGVFDCVTAGTNMQEIERQKVRTKLITGGTK